MYRSYKEWSWGNPFKSHTLYGYNRKRFYAPGNKRIYMEYVKTLTHTGKDSKHLYKCSNCGREVSAREQDMARRKNPCNCCYEDTEAEIERNLRAHYSKIKQRHINRHGCAEETLIPYEEYKGLCLTDKCSYCGGTADVRMVSAKGTHLGYKMSIDRIDSSEGYTLENCTASCVQCNKAKLEMSPAEFFAYIERVYKYNYGE